MFGRPLMRNVIETKHPYSYQKLPHFVSGGKKTENQCDLVSY